MYCRIDCKLVYHLFLNIFLLAHTCNCIDITKNILTSKSIGTQRRQRANPRVLILNIEGATYHSCLENHSGAKYEIFNVTFPIFNRIIIRFNGFESICPYISSNHIYHLIIKNFVVEIHHGHFHFLVNTFFWFYRSYTRCTSYFEDLFFPCEM